MAGKIKDMSNVKQMLRLHQNGVSNRQIAKELSVDKETVNRYVKRAKQDQLSIKELLKLDDPVLQYRMSGGNPRFGERSVLQCRECGGELLLLESFPKERAPPENRCA